MKCPDCNEEMEWQEKALVGGYGTCFRERHWYCTSGEHELIVIYEDEPNNIYRY